MGIPPEALVLPRCTSPGLPEEPPSSPFTRNGQPGLVVASPGGLLPSPRRPLSRGQVSGLSPTGAHEKTTSTVHA
jgi:hypothetical protein